MVEEQLQHLICSISSRRD